MKRSFSLRRKLTLTFLGLWLISVVLSTLAAYWFAGQAAQISFDRILKDDALVLGAQIRWGADGPIFNLDNNTADLLIFDSSSPSQYAILDKHKRQISGDLDPQLVIGFSHFRNNGAQFFDVSGPKGDLRVVALRIDRDINDYAWVVVAESNVKRNVISHELAAAIFLPAVGLGFIVVPLLLFGIRLVLEPARTISEQVARKGIDDLSGLQLDGVPEELQMLIGHLNDLLQRLQEAIEHERRFIADAAHQLRTPVAGIKVLVDDLVRTHTQAPTAPPDSEVVGELHAAATRATHLVQQLLSLARNELSKPITEHRIDVARVFQEVIQVWSKRIEEAGKTWHCQCDPQALAQTHWVGSDWMLSEALNNVLDNALRYGGDTINLEFVQDRHQTSILISDNGVGVDSQDVENMLTPFWRGDEVDAGGVGLGLPIAAGAIRQMNGRLHIVSRPEFDGMQVQLIFT